MRKIKTQEEIDRTNRRNQFILGAVLIFLLIAATVGYSFLDKNTDNSGSEIITEKGLEFSKIGDMWNTQIQGVTLQFSYLPSEVGNISVNGEYSLGDYSSQVVYFSEYNQGTVEILTDLGKFFQRYQMACFSNSTCDNDVPAKTCADNFIVFKDGENAVYKNQSCVFVVGDSKKSADAFIYKILGIN